MISLLKQGKANGILCWKVDRLARNSVDEGIIKYLLQKGVIQNIKASDRDWYPDDNVLLSAVEFGVATQYSRDLAKHIKRGLKDKAIHGNRPSIAPLGYLNSKYHEKGKECILVDPERFDLVRKLFDLVLAGKHTPLQVLRIATNEWKLTTRGFGSRPPKELSKSNTYRMLINPFYYGDYEYPQGSGNWYVGNHKPMITKAEYDQIQHLLEGKGHPRTDRKLTYVGLIHCPACGAYITGEEKWKKQQNGNIHHYTYYHCTKRVDKHCPQKAVEEKELERQILGFLSNIEIPQSFHEWAIEALKETNESEKVSRDHILKRQRQLYDQTIRKLDALLDLRLSGEITLDEYADKKTNLEKEKADLNRSINDTDSQMNAWIKLIEDGLSLAERAKREFEIGDPEARRSILASFGYNLFLKDRKLIITTEKPLSFVKEAASVVRDIQSRLEPPKTIADKQRIKESYSQSPPLWTTVKDVGTMLEGVYVPVLV